jgi:putative membrane-bound dehydrogenase-like protein
VRSAAVYLVLAAAILGSGSSGRAGNAPGKSGLPRFSLPPGFVIEKVAGPPLVKYPLFACFDDRGRLFVAEGTGTNLPGAELMKLKKQLGKITLLEDTDGDGVFDKATTFVDDLTFPTGVLWHDGAVYATSHPNLWRFPEIAPGKAGKREVLVSRFNFNGNGCDIHGPFLGPDGRLYWTDGRHGYQVKTREGKTLEGFASRIWRCRPDGRDIERIAGGGFDNPVELAFLPTGEVIGTMDQGPGDALLHYVEGGVYPMDHRCVKEFSRTGPMLGAVRQYGAALPVALCGLCRYRSTAFGDDYRDCLLSAQFNVHRIERHTLVRDGSTYRSKEADFLTSSDYDTHFTDVLEDADGSILVVDMGAWFNYGCPTSKIARPEVLGAIYRIRRKDAPRIADPWGRKLNFSAHSATDLARLLDDARPKVRDQAIDQLGKRGIAAVDALTNVLNAGSKQPSRTRRNAVWSLCRIPGVQARAAIRTALAHPDNTVRHAAMHAIGLERDGEAVKALTKAVVEEELPLRLKAAEGLGRIGKADAVPALFDSVRKGGDRFLEHAAIYALIRINDPGATHPALSDANPRVRQAGLIALDQMAKGTLTREQVVPLLDTDDCDLQQAALEVMGRRPGWSSEAIGLLRGWLGSASLTTAQQTTLTGSLLAFSGDVEVQRLVSDTLRNTKTSIATRLLLLRVLARSRSSLPAAWLAALGDALDFEDHSVRREAIGAIKARSLSGLDDKVEAVSKKPTLPEELRIAALDCVSGRLRSLPPVAFELLTAHLSEKTDPLLRATAARALGAAPLDARQLTDLSKHLSRAGPMVVPLAVPAFLRSRDPAVGRALVEALKRAPGTDALAADDLDRLLKVYPDEVRNAGRPLLARLAERQKEQAAFLAKLIRELLRTPGNVERGKEVFFSKKAGCYACHRAIGKGGNVGPDLSQVGRFRTTRDLLESIVFPSSSIVPEYRQYLVTTKKGRTTLGMIVRETADTIYLRTSDLAEIRVSRTDVEEITPSKVSLMPEGLEKTMSRQELSDVLEFLYAQK